MFLEVNDGFSEAYRVFSIIIKRIGNKVFWAKKPMALLSIA